ncbi:UPF0688 protein C1orf174 homolog isoform X1 [Scyliorhinus canicula]|uniref:UPF0688 protein C1orf174 homolog isoform X1 n=2 Tax=Scyliorhinus canicula TaxID=7830 RepID=UPI0018F61B2D|nr:UPF0688 protein C1orf174 homolog isoform X1 [Scyliorhinus canicula]
MKTKQVGVRRSARLKNRELCSAASNTPKQDAKDDSSMQKTIAPSHEAMPALDKIVPSPSNHPSKKQKCERVETEEEAGTAEQVLEDSGVILPHKPPHKSTEQNEKPIINEDCAEVTPAPLENEAPSTTIVERRYTEIQVEHVAETEELISKNGPSTEMPIKKVLEVIDEGMVENKEDIEKTARSVENDTEGSNNMEIDQPPAGTSFKVDNSIFLDEDSNQPMPVGKFFGNVEIMQDLPQSVPLLDSVTRREYRRRHFIAKDEEDEELEDRAVDEREGEPRDLSSSENEVPVGTEMKVNSLQQNTPDIVEKCL